MGGGRRRPPPGRQTDPTRHTPRITRPQRLTLAATILGSAIVFVDSTVVNVALPAIRSDLGAGLAGQQWVVESYLLMLSSLILVGGSLGDLHDRRWIFGIGVAGFGVASVGCAVAPTVEVLVVARALQGVAGALLVPSSLAIITAVFPPAERGAAIGTWTAVTAGAVALGPPIGGLLVDAGSWRWVFIINVPLVAAALWLIVRAVPACPGAGGRRLDLPGAALCAVGLGAPVYALIQQPLLGWSDPTVIGGLVLGAVLFIVFVWWERRAPDPMVPLRLFASRTFTVTNAVTLAVYAGLGAATFFLGIYLQQVAGYTATQAGFSLLPLTVMLVTLSRAFGALSTRSGPRLPMTAGPLLAGAGLALFLRVDAGAAYAAQVLPAVVVFGLGLSMTVAPLTATVLGAVDTANAGIASGINNAIARMAGLLAVAVVGAVVAARFGAVLDARLADVRLTGDTAAAVADARKAPLGRPDLPAGTPAAQRAVVQAGATDASVSGFRWGMGIAALLAAVGGVIAFAGLPRRPRPAPAAQRLEVAAADERAS